MSRETKYMRESAKNARIDRDRSRSESESSDRSIVGSQGTNGVAN